MKMTLLNNIGQTGDISNEIENCYLDLVYLELTLQCPAYWINADQ